MAVFVIFVGLAAGYDSIVLFAVLTFPRCPHDVLTIDASASVADAVAALSDAHLKKVPVVSGEDHLMIGIVGRSAINRLAEVL